MAKPRIFHSPPELQGTWGQAHSNPADDEIACAELSPTTCVSLLTSFDPTVSQPLLSWFSFTDIFKDERLPTGGQLVYPERALQRGGVTLAQSLDLRCTVDKALRDWVMLKTQKQLSKYLCEGLLLFEALEYRRDNQNHCFPRARWLWRETILVDGYTFYYLPPITPSPDNSIWGWPPQSVSCQWNWIHPWL